MKNSKTNIFLLFLLFFNSVTLFSKNESNYVTVYEKVAHDYFQASNSITSFLYKDEDSKDMDASKKLIILQTFIKLDKLKKPIYPEIISSSFFEDLEVILGRHNPMLNLFSKINKTETICGEIELLKIITTPTNKIEEIKTRQDIVKELIENKETFDKVDQVLKIFKKNESAIINYLANNRKQVHPRELYFKIFPEEWNKSPLALELASLTEKFMLTKNLTYSPKTLTLNVIKSWHHLWNVTLGTGDYKEYRNFILKQRLKKNPAHGSTLKDKITNGFERFWDWDKAHFQAGDSLIAAYKFFWDVKFFIENTSEAIKTCKYLQQELIKIKSVFNSMEALGTLLQKLPLTSSKLPAVANLGYVFNKLKINNDNIKYLFELLDKKTFNDSNSILYRFGNVLVAHKLLVETHELFHESIRAIGEIDAYMSIARLYKNFENCNVKYSFVNLIDKNEPYLKLNAVWNPFLNPQKVVTNNIELGTEGAHRNAIITGPNAGGKSTILKAILISAFLAQTLGIAPAESAIMSPFDKIVSYMNPTDDTAGGNSLFMTETIRASKLINTLKTGVKALVVSDEMLTGTDAIEGSAGAYSFAYNFAQYKNGIVVLATHFPYLTKLEKETNGIYANYKVSIDKVEAKSISYPFKIERGIANQHVAIDILKIKGIDTEILNKAKELIEQHRNNNINLFATPSNK